MKISHRLREKLTESDSYGVEASLAKGMSKEQVSRKYMQVQVECPFCEEKTPFVYMSRYKDNELSCLGCGAVHCGDGYSDKKT